MPENVSPWIIGGLLTAVIAAALWFYQRNVIRKNKSNPGWKLLTDAQENEKNKHYTEAMKQYKQAERYFNSENNTKDLAKAVFFQALLYRRVKKYDEAMNRFQRSVDLCIQLGDSESRAHAYMKMAETCSMQKSYRETKDYYKKAIDIWNDLGKVNFLNYATYHLGLTDAKHGNNKDALYNIEAAIDGFGKTLDLTALCDVLIEAAGIEEQIGANEPALKNLREAEKYLKRLKDKENGAVVRQKIEKLENKMLK